MNVPIDIIATLLAVILTAMLAQQRLVGRRIEKLEKRVLIMLVMLRERGFKVPTGHDTDRFMRDEEAEGI